MARLTPVTLFAGVHLATRAALEVPPEEVPLLALIGLLIIGADSIRSSRLHSFACI
jgi:hypothetical protein